MNKFVLVTLALVLSLGMSAASLVRSLQVTSDAQEPGTPKSTAPAETPSPTGSAAQVPPAPTIVVTTAPRLTVEGFRCKTYKLALTSYSSGSQYSVEELNGWEFVAWYPEQTASGSRIALVCR